MGMPCLPQFSPLLGTKNAQPARKGSSQAQSTKQDGAPGVHGFVRLQGLGTAGREILPVSSKATKVSARPPTYPYTLLTPKPHLSPHLSVHPFSIALRPSSRSLLRSHLPHPVSLAGLWRPCWTHSVLQPVPASSQVHVSGVSVIEAAFTELASEADHLPLVTAHLGQNTAQLPASQQGGPGGGWAARLPGR